MNLKGWIIYNGSLSGEKFTDYANMLEEACTKQGIHVSILRNDELYSFMSTTSSTILKHRQADLPDFVLFTDKDIYLAKQLETVGIRVYNSSEAIAISDDKIETFFYLREKELPVPKTIVAPKQFVMQEVTNEKISMLTQTLGLPLIIKEAFGSFGEQVYLAATEKEIKTIIQKIGTKPHLYQEYIKESNGRDLRLQVVGNEVVAAMERTNKDDFRANVTAGGTMKNYSPSAYETALAVRATQAIGADFAGVDLLFASDGERLICEINSNAHIRNLLDSTGVNVADKIVSYVVEDFR